MRHYLEQFIQASPKKIISTYELEMYVCEKMGTNSPCGEEFSEQITRLVSEGLLTPVVSRKAYESHPALYSGYRIVNVSRRNRNFLLKQVADMDERISLGYYENNLDKLKRDLKSIKTIDAFLKQADGQTAYTTVKMRSFWLFHDENFLASRKGRLLLQNLQLSYDDLRCYEPPPPFAYTAWGAPVEHNQILIIEGRDVFSQFHSLLSQRDQAGHQPMVNMLICGDGDRIEQSLAYFAELLPFQGKENHFFYFGDVSYERFHFIRQLQKKYAHLHIQPFVPLYEQLIGQCAAHAPHLKVIRRTKQKDEDVATILRSFSEQAAEAIQTLFANSRFLPHVALDPQALIEIL